MELDCPPSDVTEVTMHKRGMTLIEIMVVIALIGLMSVFAYPRLGDALTRQNVRSARAAFIGLCAKARYTAIQRGSLDSLILSNSSVTIRATNPITRASQKVGNAVNLNARYGVTVVPANLVMVYDGRGVGMNTGWASDSTSVTIKKGNFSTNIVMSASGRVIR